MRKIERREKPSELAEARLARFEHERAREYFDQRPDRREPREFMFRSATELPAFMVALAEAFDHKCAYCEQSLKRDDQWELDLYRPRGFARQFDGTIQVDCYWWLNWEWTNMYLSCKTCNRTKGTLFPTAGPRARRGSGDMELAKEHALLLDPCADDPPEHLRFLETGVVAPGKSPRAGATIDVLRLNRPELKEARQEAAQQLRQRFEQDRSGFHEVLVDRTLPFSTMAQQLAEQWLAEPTPTIVVGSAVSPQKIEQPDEKLWIGKTLEGRWFLEGILGDGGFGMVYSATDRKMKGRAVAIKVPHARGEEFERRWEDEVQLLQRHDDLPHIVKVLDRGKHQGRPFLVLQHLGGGALSDRLKNVGQMSLESVIAWLTPIAKALDSLHDRGVVHRDLKPANIVFNRSGDAFLVDFGIARALGDETVEADRPRKLTVTPAHMPPDPWMKRRIGPAYDQYSLASVSYQSLAGQPPFASGGFEEIRTRKIEQAAPSIREVLEDVPDTVESALARGLERNPDDRFTTCTEFVRALTGGV